MAVQPGVIAGAAGLGDETPHLCRRGMALFPSVEEGLGVVIGDHWGESAPPLGSGGAYVA